MKNYCLELDVLVNLAKVGLASRDSEQGKICNPDEIVGIKDLAGNDVMADLVSFTAKMQFMIAILQAKVIWIVETRYEDSYTEHSIREYDGSDGQWSISYHDVRFKGGSRGFCLLYDVDSSCEVPLHDVFLTKEGAEKALKSYGK